MVRKFHNSLCTSYIQLLRTGLKLITAVKASTTPYHNPNPNPRTSIDHICETATTLPHAQSQSVYIAFEFTMLNCKITPMITLIKNNSKDSNNNNTTDFETSPQPEYVMMYLHQKQRTVYTEIYSFPESYTHPLSPNGSYLVCYINYIRKQANNEVTISTSIVINVILQLLFHCKRNIK